MEEEEYDNMDSQSDNIMYIIITQHEWLQTMGENIGEGRTKVDRKRGEGLLERK